MKKQIFLLVITFFIGYSCYLQVPTLTTSSVKIQPALDLSKINFNTLAVADVISGAYKIVPVADKFSLLANMNNRFKQISKIIGIPQKQFEATNGLRYYVSKNTVQLPPNNSGTMLTNKDQQDNLVCRSTPLALGKQFMKGLLLIPSSATMEYNSVYPGSLFKDVDIINGNFTPLNLRRKAGTIAINVSSNSSNIETVSNFGNKNVVKAAISILVNRVGNSNANTDHTSDVFELKASQDLSMKIEGSTNVDFTELLGLPLGLGSHATASSSLDLKFNAAVAYLKNINYTISMAGDVNGQGLQSTIDEPIPADAVCVTDVLYGSVAFIIVTGMKTRQEAELAAGDLLEVAQVAGGNGSVSAVATRALEASAVKVMVFGGGGSGSVNTVTNVQQLRNELAKSNTVTGANAQPIFYILRYASDESPVKIAAFSQFDDTQCFKADKLDINIIYTKLVKNAELDGNEELFGHIFIAGSDFGGNSTIDDRNFWERSKGNALKKFQGETIGMDNQSITFNVNPAFVNFDNEVITLTIDIKDKIEDGPEYAGTTNSGRANGYVQYDEKKHKINLADIRDSPNGTLTKIFKVTEGASEVDVKVEFKLKL